MSYYSRSTGNILADYNIVTGMREPLSQKRTCGKHEKW